ncbi:DUF1631 family protein [Ramlibacter sp. PS4R-6]|uniref:DUF1631 family protein n=1 Tax=Ramlibacter sp. PS4R-6 TaxID=3133438 RepID=UPI003099EC48
MATHRTPANGPAVARKAREQFVANVSALLGPLGTQIRARLLELAQTPGGSREMQERRDAMMDFDKKGPAFVSGTAKAWQKAVEPPTATGMMRLDAMMNLQLVGEDVVDRKIMSSRLALVIGEKAVWDLNDLKVRIQHLEGEDQSTTDILRPETLCLTLVEQWGAAGLSNEAWNLVQDLVLKVMLETVPKAYTQLNEFLVANNVLRDIDFSARVRRGANAPAQPRPPQQQAPGEQPPQDSGPGTAGAPMGGGGGGDWGGGGGGGGMPAGGVAGAGGSYGFPETTYVGGGYGAPAGGGGGGGGGGGYAGGGQAAGAAGGYAPQGGGGAMPQGGGGHAPQGGYGAPAGGAPQGPMGGNGQAGAPMGARGAGGAQHTGGGHASTGHAPHTGISDETRMMTSSPPLARARARASGVIGQLKRLLTDRVAGYDAAPATRPSPALAEALSHEISRVHDTVVEHTRGGAAGAGAGDEDAIVVYDDAAVQRVAVDLRQRTGELKKKANTDSEKATIEIVALMFQAILAEERIPAAIRVWFARLQMPVLRVAIGEPEFFSTLEHPARQLIDRMGSVVMGFDAGSINGSALELEIKRIVQVIEQYPETGRRVFQLVYEEFQKFLAKFLTEEQSRQKVVSVAQQVEQKETMAIQYTIEMRKLLADMPVREEIREFLFKVWAEVLALAAVKHGPKNEETLAFKAAASELVWAASAKPNRSERAKVIQDLPKLLGRLRQGMALVGITGKAQEAQVKAIGDIFADAFLSKTEAIPQDRIDAMTKRLENLEDFVGEDPDTDLPLDRESIEMMLGIDASMIEVIADGGSKPNAAMISWANELQLGNWFALDHNGATTQVQYVWRSERKQLHLFAARGGRSYLVQAKRLAAYLQAGLLLPAEEEALTVRATRDALAKLDANPERLFQ